MEVITNKQTKHFKIERADRIAQIKKITEIGNIVAIAPDRKHRDCFNCLTDTGVMIIRAFDGTMVTLWIARVNQAKDIWKRTTGSDEMPSDLYWRVHYNNNTRVWRNQVAA